MKSIVVDLLEIQPYNPKPGAQVEIVTRHEDGRRTHKVRVLGCNHDEESEASLFECSALEPGSTALINVELYVVQQRTPPRIGTVTYR